MRCLMEEENSMCSVALSKILIEHVPCARQALDRQVRCSAASRGNSSAEAQRPKDTWCELAAQCGQDAAGSWG